MSRPTQTAEYHWESAKRRFPNFIMADPNSGCWLWTGALKPSKYGTISIGKRSTYAAHRFSYEIHNGPIPEGHLVLHKCDVPYCVNPTHLTTGTQKDNMRDAWSKGRGVHPDCNGENAEWAKLTAAEVVAIRAEPKKRGSGMALARRYNVSPQTICDIRNRRTWTA